MRISTPAELGAYIRDQRKARGLSQDDVAKTVPCSQKWVSEVENGKATAEVGQVMRLLSVLGVSIDLGSDDMKSGVRNRKAAQKDFIPPVWTHANQGQKALSDGTRVSRPLIGHNAKTGLFYPVSKNQKSNGTPVVRFRRAVAKNGNKNLEEQSVLLQAAFKRWGFK